MSDERDPMEIAEQRIEVARLTKATEPNLNGLELPGKNLIPGATALFPSAEFSLPYQDTHPWRDTR